MFLHKRHKHLGFILADEHKNLKSAQNIFLIIINDSAIFLMISISVEIVLIPLWKFINFTTNENLFLTIETNEFFEWKVVGDSSRRMRNSKLFPCHKSKSIRDAPGSYMEGFYFTFRNFITLSLSRWNFLLAIFMGLLIELMQRLCRGPKERSCNFGSFKIYS